MERVRPDTSKFTSRGSGGEYRPTDNIHSVQSINGRFINNFACILLRVHRHNQTTVNYHRATMRMENINEKWKNAAMMEKEMTRRGTLLPCKHGEMEFNEFCLRSHQFFTRTSQLERRLLFFVRTISRCLHLKLFNMSTRLVTRNRAPSSGIHLVYMTDPTYKVFFWLKITFCTTWHGMDKKARAGDAVYLMHEAPLVTSPGWKGMRN